MEEDGRGRPGGPAAPLPGFPGVAAFSGLRRGPAAHVRCAAHGRLCGGRGTLPPARACARPAPTAWRRLPVAAPRSLPARGRSWGDAHVRSEQGVGGPRPITEALRGPRISPTSARNMLDNFLEDWGSPSSR